jgi:hypothetical protein
MDFTDTFEDNIINYFPNPANEVPGGGGYARVAITFSAPTTPGVTYNAGPIVFPVATAPWATANYVAIFDNLGNYLLKGTLSAGVTVNTGQQLTIPVSNLQLTVD